MSEMVQSLRLMAVSPDPEVLQWFSSDLEAVAVNRGDGGLEVAGTPIDVVRAGDPATAREGGADILLGLIRYVDGISLKALGELMQAVAGEKACPASVLVYRKEQESDFKMGCPFCGQKIWVRDADQDKRGRCPNCHKGFTLPCQIDHVARVLQLPVSRPVRRVVQGDVAALAAQVKHLLRVRADEITLRMADSFAAQASGETMNVKLETDPLSK